MPKSHKGYKFILCIIDKVANYLISVLIYHSRSEEIGNALIEDSLRTQCIYVIINELLI